MSLTEQADILQYKPDNYSRSCIKQHILARRSHG